MSTTGGPIDTIEARVLQSARAVLRERIRNGLKHLGTLPQAYQQAFQQKLWITRAARDDVRIACQRSRLQRFQIRIVTAR